MTIGEIEGVEAGVTFENRRALHDAGILRPLQAGIAGGASSGAESIILSGGYVDDQDYGDEIIYTGHGGRDPTSGRGSGVHAPEPGPSHKLSRRTSCSRRPRVRTSVSAFPEHWLQVRWPLLDRQLLEGTRR